MSMNHANTFELLVDKIDGLQTETNEKMLQSMLSGNSETAAEFERLQSIVAGIREAGIYRQVSTVRGQFNSAQLSAQAPAKVVNFKAGRTMLRVAAAVILILV